MSTDIPRITTQEVALVLGMIALVIVAGMYAPGVVSIISGIISTLVGAFFVNARRDKPAPVLQLVPKAEDENGGAS